MSSSGMASVLRFGESIGTDCFGRRGSGLLFLCKARFCSSPAITCAQQTCEQLLLVVGGGAAGVYASLRAKQVAPHLNVLLIEKGKPLSKVKISGGGRCNVTNGHFLDKMALAENYPRGNKELRGSFFSAHSPEDTMRWFSDHGVELKTEEDGRVFPVSNSSASVVDCLLQGAKRSGVVQCANFTSFAVCTEYFCHNIIHVKDTHAFLSSSRGYFYDITGKVVSEASVKDNGRFILKVEKRTVDYLEHIESDYLLIATGSSQQGYNIALQLGHSIIDPMPSLFTFKIEDAQLASLSGVSFPKVKAKLKLEIIDKNIPELSQVGPMLVTHWGLSGPAILRLSAWGARGLFRSNYRGMLYVDFLPDIHTEDVKHILFEHRDLLAKQKVNNSFPSQFGLVKRFWRYLLEREGLDGDTLWASVSNNHLNSIALLLKQCPFKVAGKGQFKDEFVTAGGVPLSEISLSTMESRRRPNLFFAGEVLNIDGITGGFNFQNAWTGGYIAGTRIGELALSSNLQQQTC